MGVDENRGTLFGEALKGLLFYLGYTNGTPILRNAHIFSPRRRWPPTSCICWMASQVGSAEVGALGLCPALNWQKEVAVWRWVETSFDAFLRQGWGC